MARARGGPRAATSSAGEQHHAQPDPVVATGAQPSLFGSAVVVVTDRARRRRRRARRRRWRRRPRRTAPRSPRRGWRTVQVLASISSSGKINRFRPTGSILATSSWTPLTGEMELHPGGDLRRLHRVVDEVHPLRRFGGAPRPWASASCRPSCPSSGMMKRMSGFSMESWATSPDQPTQAAKFPDSRSAR